MPPASNSLSDNKPAIDRIGLVCAVGAHTLWGLFPIYWRLVDVADSTELVCHRIVWSFVSLAIVLPILLRRGWWGGGLTVIGELRSPRVWLTYGIAAIMIAINWAAFIWAVNHDRVLDASLGYYINPLINVLLGVAVLGERLDRWQWFAVGVAAVGVLIMAIGAGGLPWVSLAMACSFAIYGLVKKRAHLPPLVGLWVEVTVLMIPAAVYLTWRVSEGASAFQLGSLRVTLMLLFAGVITITPLALFAVAVRRLDLSLIGLLQYVGPTLQFLVGAVMYNEPLDRTRMSGFAFVWLALVLYIAATHRPRRLGTLTGPSVHS